MGKKEEPEALKELRDSIVASAAEAIVAQMTPQQMRACAEGILESLIGEIGTDKYSDLGRLVNEKMIAAMKDYLETDNAKSQIRSAVIQGVNAALEGMSEAVKGKVVDVALGGMVKALENKQNRGY
jgi:hypothetical protein